MSVQSAEGDKTGTSPPENWESETKIYKKSEDRSLIPITWFNSCNDSVFAGMTITLRKNQIHYCGVMQRWACSSLMSAALQTNKVIICGFVNDYDNASLKRSTLFWKSAGSLLCKLS